MKIDAFKPKPATMNLTPIMDVVFLLIVFFIVSGNLIHQDVPVDLPDAQTGQRSKLDAENRIVTLNVPQKGTLFAGTQPVTLEDIRRLAVPKRCSSIRIRTGKNVSYGDIEPILVLAAENGINDVTFAVKEQDR